MSAGEAIAVKYVLYTHYWQQEKEDFQKYRPGQTAFGDLTVAQDLMAHFNGLRSLLTAPGHEGMLVIFYASGYTRFLEALAKGEDISDLLNGPADEDCNRLCFARDVSTYIKEKLDEFGFGDRVRFLTPIDLNVIFGEVNELLAGKFEKFFFGLSKGLRYDAPKVVEAILRLRFLGMGVPLLRLDQDVLFHEDNKNTGDLGLFKAIACAVRSYRLRVEQTAISSFMFSGSYDSRELLERPSKKQRFDAWSGAFATRIFPALIASPRTVERICTSKRDRNKLWKQYAAKYLDPALACRYYGLKPITDRLEADDRNGLISVGAHPLHAVISGALLCLSDGAILDLPPFSNFSENVMWIDDHLKYSLHRAMNHFLLPAGPLRIDSRLADARLDDVTVTKARPAVTNLPFYIFGIYIPTLLYGTIVDSWITTDSLLKCRRGSLATEDERKAWMRARENQDKAPLPKALIEALKAGAFEDRAARKLEELLITRALERIEEVRQLWAGLQNKSGRSFASYWAEGTVQRKFKACFPEEGIWSGLTHARPLDQKITEIGHLSSFVSPNVLKLVSDALDYVRWTLAWPQFVQIVRSTRQGNFIGDLSWRSRAAAPETRIPTPP